MADKNKFQLLCEFVTMDQTEGGNKMMQGEERPAGPKHMTLSDIVDQHNKNKETGSKAPNVLPAPLTNNHLEAIASIYVNSAAIQIDIKTAAQNPIIKENRKLLDAVKSVYRKFTQIKKIIKSMDGDLNKFSIEK